VVGVLNAIVGLYYYLNVLKYVYLFRTEKQDEERQPLPLSRPAAIALILLVAGVILLGTLFGPWFGLASRAASSIQLF